ncbi:hypothetical protein T07_6761 [Trichinella nelsoni]|uniref:Uncharacterized protein n=1 Tax=Trichinella nelsoni TaxID=6336 RepID=A0A0V0RAX3_9BILA|nr:hypothetical protein T07_6761 [Trichinella nelsoni]
MSENFLKSENQLAEMKYMLAIAKVIFERPYFNNR